jgi:hypothetical protein
MKIQKTGAEKIGKGNGRCPLLTLSARLTESSNLTESTLAFFLIHPGINAVDNADELAQESPQSLNWMHNRVTQHVIDP